MTLVVCIYVEINDFKNSNSPKNGEAYTLEEANFSICFNDNGTTSIEHVLSLMKNHSVYKGYAEIPYTFKESGEIINHSISINGETLTYSEDRRTDTYSLQEQDDEKTFIITCADNNDMKIEISYDTPTVAYPYGETTILNYVFLSFRNGFSYRGLKGVISFEIPLGQNMNDYDIAAHCEDVSISIKNESAINIEIYYEQKIPYTEGYFLEGMRNIKRQYDPTTIYGDYVNDYTIRTLLRLPSSSLGNTYVSANSNEYDLSAIQSLKSLNKKSNEKFSDIKFSIGFINLSLSHKLGLVCIFLIPASISIWRKRKEEKRKAEQDFYRNMYELK